MNKRTVIIIPVYNEAKVIRAVLHDVEKKFNYIVCVNDGSRDNSASEIAKTSAYLIEHPINMGQGAALQTGIEFARQLPVDYFVTFDADGQHNLNDVTTMLKELSLRQYDIVLGSRFLGSTIGMRASKKLILRVAVVFSNMMSGLKLTDTHNGLRAFNRHVAEMIEITLPDMSHASEILEIIAEKKFRYKEIPVTIEYTDYSRAKGQSLTNAVNIGFDTLLRRFTK
jgi:polyprenyl-phospho-N-acetylgalactosaminyl synthase